MKILKHEGENHEKVNFVDKNNVFVGYDMEQICCEHFAWFISEKEETKVFEFVDCEKTLVDVENYVFDTNYFEEHIKAGKVKNTDKYGWMVRFRLTNGENELFLHLYNAQNGYYSHGFEAKIDTLKWKKGEI